MSEGKPFIPDWYMRHDVVLSHLRGMDKPDLLKAIANKEFGDDAIKVGKFFFVSASGLRAYLESRRIFDSTGELRPVFARSPGELTAKARAAKRVKSSS